MKKQQKEKTYGVSPLPFTTMKDWQAIAVIVLGVGLIFRDIILQHAFLWDDFLYFIYPIRNFAAVSLSQGELPLWNPYTFSGMPFLADIQSGIFYIPNLLMTLFVSNNQLHFYWVELLTIVHYIIGGVCMYYLARNFGLQRISSLVAGLLYPLSGFMLVHSIHLVHICQMAWFPLVLLLFRKAILERSVQHMIYGGLVLGLAALVGFPQVTLHIFFFLLLYFLFEFTFGCRENGLKQAWTMSLYAAGSIVISVGVMAIQFLPTLEIIPLSVRADISYEATIIGSVQWKQFLTLLVPNYFGATHQHDITFWLTKNYWEYWETAMYLGLFPLTLVVLALSLLKKNRYIAFLAGVALFGLLFAMGDNFFIYPFFYTYIPGFDKFRVPGRLNLYVVFAAALLSAFSLEHIFSQAFQQTKHFRKLPLFILVTAGVVFLVGQLELFQPASNTPQYEAIHAIASSETTKSVVLLLILAGLFFIFVQKMFSTSLLVAAFLVFHVVDINLFGLKYINGVVNPQEYFGRTARLIDFIKEDGKDEYFRVNSRQGGTLLLDRNQGMIDRVFMMEGFGALVLQRMSPPRKEWDEVCDMLNAKYRIKIDEQRRTANLATATTYVPRAYMVYQTRVVEGEENVKAFLESNNFDFRTMAVFEEPVDFSLSDTTYSTDWSAKITSYKLNSISLEVETPKDGILMLSEIYCPGWTAYVDGVKGQLYRANWSLRAVPVLAGKHVVEVRYEPESFYRGMWITLATLGLSIAGITFSSRKKQQSSA